MVEGHLNMYFIIQNSQSVPTVVKTTKNKRNNVSFKLEANILAGFTHNPLGRERQVYDL